MPTVKTNQLTLLAFENDWCPQCYTERPIIEAIAEKFAGQVKVKTLNVNKYPQLTKKLNVLSAPSFVLLRDREVVDKSARFMDEEQLEALIRYYL